MVLYNLLRPFFKSQFDNMEGKRYDIVCKSAREKIKGIDCILEMIDDGCKFHDSVLERFDLDTDNEVLVVDIGDVWDADQVPAGRFRFTFRGYMEVELGYTTGSSFTYDFSIYESGRLGLFVVEFNTLYLHVICRDITIEETPYTEAELLKFNH